MKSILFLFLTLLLFTRTVISFDLIPSQLSCLNNLATKTNDPALLDPNIGTKICQGTTIGYCDADGNLMKIAIVQATSNELKWDDFNCFPSLSILILNSYSIDPNFLYNNTNGLSLKEIHLYPSTLNPQTINQELIPLNHFFLYNISQSQSDFKASYLKNVLQFDLASGSLNIEVDGDQSTSRLTFLKFFSNSFPNLSTFPNITTLSFGFREPFNSSTFVNIKNIGNLQSLIFKSLTSPFIVPDLFELLKQSGNKLTLLQIEENVHISSSTNKQIDLYSFSSLKSFSLFGREKFKNFSGVFPFLSLPQNLFTFNIQEGNYTMPTDLKVFENVKVTSILNSNLSGYLPKNLLSTYESIIISNTNLKGTLDESWCDKNFDLSNNLLSGPLPDCFFCYLNISSVSMMLFPNDFTNYVSNRYNCDNSKISISSFTFIDSNTFKVEGKNIGLSTNIVTSPSSTILVNLINRPMIGSIPNTYPTTKFSITFMYTVPPINITIDAPPRPPVLNKVTQNNVTIDIVGSCFSYTNTDIKVKVGNIDCIVIQSNFSNIMCEIPYPIAISGNQMALVTVHDMSTSLIVSINQTNILCYPNDCNGNGICNSVLGICNCNNDWITKDNNICTIAKHYVSSTSQVYSETGGNITLFGLFGSIHDNPQLIVNGKSSTAFSITNTSFQIIIPPGNGSIDITFIQNGESWSGKIYPYLINTLLCPNNCGGPNQGSCNTTTGECTCKKNFIGLDCHPLPKDEDGEESLPPSTTEIGSTGTTTITNEQTAFKISIQSVVEIDFNGNEIDSSLIKLQGNWTYNKNKSISTFNRTIDSTTTTTAAAAKIIFILTIEEVIDNDKLFTFADNTFTVKKDGIKMSLSISNWNYRSNLNTLRVKMLSDIIIDDTKNINTCNDNSESFIESSSNSNDLIGNLNYLKFSYNGKILQGRFQNKMLSDGRPTTTLTNLISKSENQIIIALNLPHCTECLLDPDFSVLVSPNFNSSTSCISNGNNDKAWLIPVAVVVPVVGLTIIIIIIFIIAKKNSTTIKIIVKGIGMKRMP
ncbi:hypothetical protein RB653_004733 [Dictyostelium firmibasis]|uniref:EGF-like domain-containing protein n=1 Tax=Dictyostelium firmibasis TaxID=79012 RepID=A0AAN7UJV5_9MYCE